MDNWAWCKTMQVSHTVVRSTTKKKENTNFGTSHSIDCTLHHRLNANVNLESLSSMLPVPKYSESQRSRMELAFAHWHTPRCTVCIEHILIKPGDHPTTSTNGETHRPTHRRKNSAEENRWNDENAKLVYLKLEKN